MNNFDLDELLDSIFDNYSGNNQESRINWIEKYYPIDGKCLLRSSDNFGKLRDEIYLLDAKNKKMNDLDLTNFVNLSSLDSSINNLTKLDLSNCEEIKDLYSSKNKLIEVILSVNNRIVNIHLWENNLRFFNYERLSKYSLTKLYISSNKLEANISVFSHLWSLEILQFDNNNFYGSFKSLYKLKRLKKISFYNNKNIISSFEWLGNNVVIYFKDRDLNIEEYRYLNLSLKNFILVRNLDLKLKSRIILNLLRFLSPVETKMKKLIDLNLMEELKLKIKNKSILNEADQKLLLYTKFKRLQFKLYNNLRLEEIDFKVLSKFVELKEEYIETIKNLQIKEDFLTLKNLNQYELMKDNLVLLNNNFQWKEGSYCLRKVQLINETFFNHNNGFNLWLGNELIKINKFKTNFYWNLIKHEKQANEQQFKQFYNQIFS